MNAYCSLLKTIFTPTALNAAESSVNVMSMMGRWPPGKQDPWQKIAHAEQLQFDGLNEGGAVSGAHMLLIYSPLWTPWASVTHATEPKH